MLEWIAETALTLALLVAWVGAVIVQLHGVEWVDLHFLALDELD